MLFSDLKRKKYYWIFVGIVSILSFGFMLTHFSVGIDDEAYDRYFGENTLAAQGRVGYIITRLFFNSYEFIPIWKSVLGILLLLISFWIFSSLLIWISHSTFNDLDATIMSCVGISIPILAEKYIFSGCVLFDPYQFLISIIGIYFFVKWSIQHKNWHNLLFSGLIMTYGYLYDPSMIMNYCIVGCAVLMVCALDSQGELYRRFNFLLIVGIQLLGVLISSFLISKLIIPLLQNIVGVSPSGYVERYIVYDFTNFINSFFISMKSVFLILYEKAINQNISYISFFIGVLLIIASAIYFMLHNKNFEFSLLCLAFFFIAVSPYLATGNPNLPERVFSPWSLWIGFSFSIGFMIIRKIKNQNIRIQNIAICIIALLVLNQTKYMNSIFYLDYLRYQQDLVVMDNVMNDIAYKTGYANKKPVVFLGNLPDYNLKKGEVAGWSIFGWDRLWSVQDEFTSKRIYPFLNMHGYHIQPPSASAQLEEKVRVEVTGMKNWPLEDSIKDIGDCILVRLGEPLYQQYNMSENSFIDYYSSSKYEVGADIWGKVDNKNLAFGGWVVHIGRNSFESKISIALISENVQYVFSTSRPDRPDVTKYLNDGFNYDHAGFVCNGIDVSTITPGKYKVAILLENNEEKSLLMQTGELLI